MLRNSFLFLQGKVDLTSVSSNQAYSPFVSQTHQCCRTCARQESHLTASSSVFILENKSLPLFTFFLVFPSSPCSTASRIIRAHSSELNRLTVIKGYVTSENTGAAGCCTTAQSPQGKGCEAGALSPAGAGSPWPWLLPPEKGEHASGLARAKCPSTERAAVT